MAFRNTERIRIWHIQVSEFMHDSLGDAGEAFLITVTITKAAMEAVLVNLNPVSFSKQTQFQKSTCIYFLTNLLILIRLQLVNFERFSLLLKSAFLTPWNKQKEAAVVEYVHRSNQDLRDYH